MELFINIILKVCVYFYGGAEPGSFKCLQMGGRLALDGSIRYFGADKNLFKSLLYHSTQGYIILFVVNHQRTKIQK